MIWRLGLTVCSLHELDDMEWDGLMIELHLWIPGTEPELHLESGAIFFTLLDE